MLTLLLTYALLIVLAFTWVLWNRHKRVEKALREAQERIEAVTDLRPLGWLLNGPTGACIVYYFEEVELAMKDICGDDPEDWKKYTSTEVFAKPASAKAIEMKERPHA